MTVEASNDCGGFRPAKKGEHLDTQMFPECAGTEADRDIVKKTEQERKRKKKKTHKSGEELRRQVIAMLGPYASNWQFLQKWLDQKYFLGGNEPSPEQIHKFVDSVTGLVEVGGKEFLPLPEDDPRYETSWKQFRKIIADLRSGAIDERTAAIRFQQALHTAKNIDVVNKGYFEQLEEKRQEKNPYRHASCACNTKTASFNLSAKTAKTAKKKSKKKKDWDPNPWAVCHTTVDKDKDPEKFERCVQDVKKKQTAAEQYIQIVKTAAMDVSEMESVEELRDFMDKHGYKLARSKYPWGETLSFEGAGGDWLHLVNGELVTFDRLKQWALYNWVPETPKEKMWAAENLISSSEGKLAKEAQVVEEPEMQLGAIEMEDADDYDVLDVAVSPEADIESFFVDVIYPQESKFEVPVIDDIVTRGIDVVLDYVKLQTQRYDGTQWISDKPYRDSKVGDVFVVNGKNFVMLGSGFAAITPAEALEWMEVPPEERESVTYPNDVQTILDEHIGLVESKSMTKKKVLATLKAASKVVTRQKTKEASKKPIFSKEARSKEEGIMDALLDTCPRSEVLAAIKRLGEESIAGFSDVTEDDVVDILLMAQPYELAEIYDSVMANRVK